MSLTEAPLRRLPLTKSSAGYADLSCRTLPSIEVSPEVQKVMIFLPERSLDSMNVLTTRGA